jgi:signal transduction histidine kinase
VPAAAPPDGDGAPWLEISVVDTGIGIAPEHQRRLFEEFYQVKGSTVDKSPGTGLGLALCRRFLAMHGGRIWAESAGVGKGSTFTLAIPVRAVAGADATASPGGPRRGGH